MARKRGRKRTKKRGRRRSYSRRRGGKRTQRGLLGRFGAFVMGGGPLILAGSDAVQGALRSKKAHGLTMPATFDIGFKRFLNDLSMGIFNKNIIEKGSFSQENGGSVDINIGSGLPGGSVWLVMGTGFALMAADYAATYLTGNKATKVPFTNITATGSR
jgi:hypothetical protein